MQIATIVPTAYLDLVEKRSYHLCLVQQLQKDPVYKEFYKRQAAAGKFVIVDNGAAERNVSTMEEVYEQAMDIGANEVQLPDKFFDGALTLHESYEAMQYLQSVNYSGKIQVVPQGRNLQEWTQCMRAFLSWNMDMCIGIPKNLVHTEGPTGREKAIKEVLDAIAKTRWFGKPPSIQVHLLGCWTDPREVGRIFRIFHSTHILRGVDSGICTIYAQEGLLLNPDKFPKPGKIVDFARTDLDLELLKENMFRWEVYGYGVL